MNAKTLIMSAAALLLANLSLAGESLPLKSVNKANEIIDAAIEAHGGAEALEGLETLIQKQDFLNIATGQSRKPGPPYDRNRVSNFNAIDVANEIFVSRNQGVLVIGVGDAFLRGDEGGAVRLRRRDGRPADLSRRRGGRPVADALGGGGGGRGVGAVGPGRSAPPRPTS